MRACVCEEVNKVECILIITSITRCSFMLNGLCYFSPLRIELAFVYFRISCFWCCKQKIASAWEVCIVCIKTGVLCSCSTNSIPRLSIFHFDLSSTFEERTTKRRQRQRIKYCTKRYIPLSSGTLAKLLQFQLLFIFVVLRLASPKKKLITINTFTLCYTTYFELLFHRAANFSRTKQWCRRICLAINRYSPSFAVAVSF